MWLLGIGGVLVANPFRLEAMRRWVFGGSTQLEGAREVLMTSGAWQMTAC